MLLAVCCFVVGIVTLLRLRVNKIPILVFLLVAILSIRSQSFQLLNLIFCQSILRLSYQFSLFNFPPHPPSRSLNSISLSLSLSFSLPFLLHKQVVWKNCLLLFQVGSYSFVHSYSESKLCGRMRSVLFSSWNFSCLSSSSLCESVSARVQIKSSDGYTQVCQLLSKRSTSTSLSHPGFFFYFFISKYVSHTRVCTINVPSPGWRKLQRNASTWFVNLN